MNGFWKAVPVWIRQDGGKKGQWNEFAGFHARIPAGVREQRAVVRIAARSSYRLYLNGERAADGPAGAAAGYCRMDEIECTLLGGNGYCGGCHRF